MQSASKTKATQNNYSELKGTYIFNSFFFLSVLNSLILIIFYTKKSYFHFILVYKMCLKLTRATNFTIIFYFFVFLLFCYFFTS